MTTTRTRDWNIHRAGNRAKLKDRREPYFRQIIKGGYVGYRTSGHWIARWRDEEGNRTHRSLGTEALLTYDQAVAVALEWFGDCGVGQMKSYTVREACEAYVRNREIEKGSATAIDADKRFVATVYDKPVAKKRLDDLRVRDIEKWRDGLLCKAKGAGA